MTTLSKDEIIAWAREAGFFLSDKGYGPDVLHTDRLKYSSRCFERFATLCRADLVAENEALTNDLNTYKNSFNALRSEIEGWQKENLANQCDLHAEVDRLKNKNKTIEGWIANGELYQRMYDAGIEQEREIRQLENELSALRNAMRTYEQQTLTLAQQDDEVRAGWETRAKKAEAELSALRAGGGVKFDVATLISDAHFVFNNPPGETPQDVRDVIEWFAASLDTVHAAPQPSAVASPSEMQDVIQSQLYEIAALEEKLRDLRAAPQPSAVPVVTQMVETLTAAKLKHLYCEDSWYSCPKHEEGCANVDAGTNCTCGADKHNAAIEPALVAGQQWLKENT